MLKEIKILFSVIAKMSMKDTYKPHAHPYYQLNHIIQGRYEYKIGKNSLVANVGDTILIPSNCVHSFTQTKDETGYYFEVKFSSFSKDVMEMCSDVGIFVENDDYSGKIFKEIFDESNNSTPKSEEIMLVYLYAILFKLGAEKRRTRNSASKYIEVSTYSAAVRDTIKFLENNYMKQLTLDEIVAQTTLHKSYLCALFKKETTVSIFECLMIIRIRQAVELLTYTPMSLAQISEETGFVSYTHFNRVFTKHVMNPPGQYRKKLESQELYWSDAIGKREENLITDAMLEGKKLNFHS